MNLKASKVENHKQLVAAYMLALLKGIGRRKAYRIWNEKDLKEAYLTCFQKKFTTVPDWSKGLGVKDFLQAQQFSEETINEHVSQQCDVLLIGSEYYPSSLSEVVDAPLVLFAKGNVHLLNKKNIAVVGTRSPSSYGKDNAILSAKYFAEQHVNVVSGFAYGIDIEAHKAAISFGGTTTAVLGSGLGNLYPKQHSKYARQILENGCFLSELPYNALPDRVNFPSRNRLVAAMCSATLVIESKVKGGSLITAKLAFDYNKEVFVYPGEINDENYTGNHALVQRQMAQLATSPKYILDQLGWNTDTKEATHKPLEVAQHLNEVYKSVLKQPKIDIHQLSQLHDESIGNLQLKLTELELMGAIEGLPGNSFKAK
jgi:DNA processing protein